jgi:two-component system sensor histidine kinase/response regulator
MELSLFVKARISSLDAANHRVLVSFIDATARASEERYRNLIEQAADGILVVEGSARRLENGWMQGILHDVTKQKQTEASFAWDRSLFNMLMANLPDYIYFKDSASRFIRTSWSHARVLGLRDPSEAVGKTDADFYGADHARKALEDELQVMKTGTPLTDIEERETYPDRPDTWAITTKMPLRNPQGEIVGTFGITHDITARKQLEEKNQELATLVESVEDAIVGYGPDRAVTVWNKGAERLYGYSAAEVIGRSTSIFIPSELEGEARLMRERMMRGEQITHFETTRLRKDGSRILVSLTLSAIRDAGGTIVGMASVARDITAEKALQAQLSRAQRLESLATLAGGIAHQFNNINTVINGYLQLIRSEQGLPARLAAFVEAASEGVQKAVDITDRLLVLTEPASASSGAVRLDLLAQSLLPRYERRIAEEKVRIALDLAGAPPVKADEVRLRFVLSSLIGNALDSLLDRPERSVSVRTGTTEDSAYFEVEDSGCGIPEEDLARIFSPFFSAKGEWAPKGSAQARLKGVGLSLAISSTMVSEYGGRIDVQSTKGTGSTFTVVLPLPRIG